MKKTLILALFFVPSIALAAFDTNLHYGSKGDDVVALQEFLTDQGVYTGPISGNFYSLTLAAVKKFQKAESITPISGYVGPITRGVMNQILIDTAPDTEGDATTTTSSVDLSQPTPVVQIPTQTAVSTPIIPVCTLSAATTTDRVGNIVAQVDWTYTGTQDGWLYDNYSGIIDGGKIIYAQIERLTGTSGLVKSLKPANHFRLDFGDTVCFTSI